MNWTTDKPTKPGYYWWRNRSPDGHARVDAMMNWTSDKPPVPGWCWYRTNEQEESLLKLGVVA